MGVPVTFINKYNPEKFVISGRVRYKINGKKKFARLLITPK